MKHIITTCLLLISAGLLFSQTATDQKKVWPAMENSPNYYDVKAGFTEYIYNLEMESELLGIEAESDDLWAKYMRWDYLMQSRVSPNGEYPSPGVIFREFDAWQKSHPSTANSGNRAGNWEPVGNAEVPTSGGAVGRINVMVFDPMDANTIYAGSADGGLWRTPDLGGTWMPLSDNIPVTGIADIAIDPTNNDIIYIATGDGYGYEATWYPDQDFWGGLYSGGVFKSVDHGATWLPTGLSYLQEDKIIIQKLLIHPDNTAVLLAATRAGIYRTDNGGDTWTLVESAHCYDMAFNGADPNIIYAVGDKDFLVSLDAGLTWTVEANDLIDVDSRMSIETTPDDPDVIYIFGPDSEIKKSINGGDTWINLSIPGYLNTYYGYWDTALGVSPLNANLVFSGGVEIVRSTNGASSWSLISTWDGYGDDNYVHSDTKGFLFDPSNVNIIYACTDGGIYKTTDKGITWTNISAGLRIAQIYRVASSTLHPDYVLCGYQDCGTILWDGSSWDRVQSGDGMDVAIDYTNDNRLYASYPYGKLTRSTNFGDTWTYLINPGEGGWLTPYEMDPVNHLIMYYGTETGIIKKSDDGGSSWDDHSTTLGGTVTDIIVAPSNTNYVYASAFQNVCRSFDGGINWTNITAGLPTAGICFNYMAVSDSDPALIWVALSGYSDGNKVYFSNDAGNTWTNISGTLPNVPVNTILFEKNSTSNRLYIGTDFGVFTKDDDEADWQAFMSGLPNVMVHELTLNPTNSKIYAATYGRGVWMSDYYDVTAPTLSISVADLSLCPGETLNVSYSAFGEYLPDNIYTVELSDATGAFITPIIIGSFISTDLTGVISCVIPAEIINGTAYRMRVKSSSPVVMSIDNGSDISIICDKPSLPVTAIVTATSANLQWSGSACAEAYEVQYKPILDATWLTTTTTSTFTTVIGLTPATNYEWTVKTICSELPYVTTENADTITFITATNSGILPLGLSSLLISPNPLTSQSNLEFELLNPVVLQITLVDISGKAIRNIFNGNLNAGPHQFIIEKNDLSAGIYSINFKSDNAVYAVPLVIE